MADVCCLRRPAPTGRRQAADSSRPSVVVDGMSRLNALRGPDAPPPPSERAVSGRYTSSHMHAPLASHEESLGVRCNALKASPGNG